MKIEKKWWATHLANRKTREIHSLRNVSPRCQLTAMSIANAIYCTRLWAWFLIAFRDYNGCRHCWTEKDRG